MSLWKVLYLIAAVVVVVIAIIVIVIVIVAAVVVVAVVVETYLFYTSKKFYNTGKLGQVQLIATDLKQTKIEQMS